MMKIKNVIEDDIVEDISIYREIMNDVIETIRSVKPDYEPNFTIDQFCVRMLNNFDGIDEEFENQPSGKMVERQLKSVLKIALEELEDDKIEREELKEMLKEYL